MQIHEVECEDDAIGWQLDFAGLIALPLAEFEVECASGWGHGVKTRAASEVIEIPNGFQWIQPHPQGGLLLLPYGRESLWSERLGVEVAKDSLVWLDDQAEKVRWLRDDLRYRQPNVVSTATGTELWVWGYDDEQDYLSRIEPSTGELLERVTWPADEPRTMSAAWPEDGGLWVITRESYDDDGEVYALQRMSSFAEAGPVLRTFESPRVTLGDGTSGVFAVSLYPTPGGGLLWGHSGLFESLAEDGSLRWVLEEPHSFRVVDEYGGFLLGGVHDGGELDDQQLGLSLQRRSLEDASVLWTRVHHRYDFANEPRPNDWLVDTAWGHAARAEGGYLIAGGHAYPASSCPQQPIVWAIDIDGEVEWAHRVETCGSLIVATRRVDGRALTLGFSYANGDASNGATKARWLQYFDL
ncbi:hypothetical protein DB30_05104 [Enhygromyxa salina]|uniref:Uncharacterized protein n=1 Tax=Enhygromyxa salina TaxID=215803 RepID=A0A0C1ZXL7_9BACT|nr:hypothetical protein DB30_05104 [Enhygromyxa salina]